MSATIIRKLSSGHYQIDDNTIPVEHRDVEELVSRSYNYDSEATQAWFARMESQDGVGHLVTEAEKGVVVDLYEVDYPTPANPMDETQNLAKHLNEKEDFITQYLFPGTPTEEVIVGLREDILPHKKKETPMRPVSMLRTLAKGIDERYKTVNKVTLPNSAAFSGDKFPSGGNPVTHEQRAWKEGDRVEDQQIRQENRAKKMYTSPLATGDADLQNVKTQMKNPSGVAPHLASIEAIRQLLADLSFTKDPDGTVEIEMTDTPPAVPPAPAAAPPAPGAVPVPSNGTEKASSLSPVIATIIHRESGLRGVLQSVASQDPQQKENTFVVSVLGTDKEEVWKQSECQSSTAKAWVIDKRGSKVLIGFECEKNAGIEIHDGAQLLKRLSVLKNGHTWRELIPQGVWQTELE